MTTSTCPVPSANVRVSSGFSNRFSSSPAIRPPPGREDPVCADRVRRVNGHERDLSRWSLMPARTQPYGWPDFDPGGRRGPRRERLPLHQPAGGRLDRVPPDRALRHQARVAGRQLPQGQRAGRQSARELPGRADLRARGAARQHHRRPRADRGGGRRELGSRRGDTARERDQRGRADLERAALAAGGRCLGLATRVLADIEATAEPELFFWERRIGPDAAQPWAALQRSATSSSRGRVSRPDRTPASTCRAGDGC